MIKKIFFLNVLCFFIFLPATYAKQKIEIATYDILPPFAYQENGRLTGIYIEIVKEAISNMPDYDYEFLIVPWKRAIGLVKNGDIFAIHT